MKHLVLLFTLVLLCYFGWYYSPEEVKDSIRKFSKTHLFKLLVLTLLVLVAFMTQATFGSGKIF